MMLYLGQIIATVLIGSLFFADDEKEDTKVFDSHPEPEKVKRLRKRKKKNGAVPATIE